VTQAADVLSAWGVPGIGEIRPGDDLAVLLGDALAADAAARPATAPQDGDVLVVTSKIVSKAEGRIVRADDREDAITAETVRVVATREHPGGITRIVENRLGLVMAAAGVDASNTDEGTVLLLPEDPDATARALRAALSARFGVRLGVLVSDTAGRPWRQGQTDIAIGAAGVVVLDDLRGSTDTHGRPLQVSMAAVADEITAAAELVKGKATGVPVAVVRGMAHVVTAEDGPGARTLTRTGPDDMFAEGTAEAYARGWKDAAGSGGAAG
jgi:coenzyme F420-0:L-glutamate ligase/coenzyme F420-1:gamma-L-glutamate ligase